MSATTTASSTGALGVLILWLFIISAVIVYEYICNWFIMVKTGDEGWKGIIPMYNLYKLYEKAGRRNMFWAYLAGIAVYATGICLLILSSVSMRGRYAMYSVEVRSGLLELFIGIILLVIGAVLMLIFMIFRCIGMAKNFGKSGGWACGLIFVYPVFLGIIAFNKNIHYTLGNPRGPYVGPVSNPVVGEQIQG